MHKAVIFHLLCTLMNLVSVWRREGGGEIYEGFCLLFRWNQEQCRGGEIWVRLTRGTLLVQCDQVLRRGGSESEEHYFAVSCKRDIYAFRTRVEALCAPTQTSTMYV